MALRLKQSIVFYMFCCMALLLTQCAYPQFHSLKPAEFADEIARMKATAKDDRNAYARAAAHRQLAMLYSYHKNPARDYHLALKELETYISLDPEKGKTNDIQNWLAVLRDLDRTSSEHKVAKNRIQQLVKENKELRETMEQLAGDNNDLRDTVEKLEQLDINIEKRRREVK